MTRIKYESATYDIADGESVLECLERAGHALPSSCRAGHCQTCLMRATEGDVPSAAQHGLKDAWRAQGMFLACVCRPEAPLTITLPDAATTEVAGRVASREVLSEEVVRIRIEPLERFDYRAGQFVNVVRPADRLTRPYSIASLPDDGALELHVRRVPRGRMSSWLCDEVSEGDEVHLRGPAGECFYLTEPERPLLLAGTSTGLAPLLGIVRDALAQGHRGPIALYHGSSRSSGLYLGDELAELAARHDHVKVVRTVLEGPAPEGVLVEPLEALILDSHPQLAAARAWLCGAPEFVKALKKRLFLGGMSLRAIASDPFFQAPG